jgi:hypothetical protein
MKNELNRLYHLTWEVITILIYLFIFWVFTAEFLGLPY